MLLSVQARRRRKRGEEEKKKKEKGRREEEENPGLELVWNCLELLFGNLSLSKLCRKNPIRNVVGWYKMSFMVYFEF